MNPENCLPQTIWESFLMLGGFMLILCQSYLLIRLLHLSVYKLHTAASGLALVFSIIFYQGMRHTIRHEFIHLPFLPLFLGYALQIIWLLLTVRYIHKMSHRKLTAMSFKEAFDTLPTGICFFRNGGMPQLVNLQMAHIFKQITGEHLSNAEEFYFNLRDKAYPCSVTGGEYPIICLTDGMAYSFTHHTVTLNGEELHELIASDITEEYQMTMELDRKKTAVKLINKRLRALNSTLRYIIIEKEVLSMKTKIHDALGTALLLGKRYLCNPEEASEKDILLQWNLSFGLLLSEERDIWKTPYFISTKYANLLGVRLELNGKLPEEEHLIDIIDTAISVHVTNTERHAHGNILHIDIEEHRHYYILRFTNNGNPPKQGVKESGGLGNLRRLAERAGGGMKLQSLPRYMLTLRLPKKRRKFYEL